MIRPIILLAALLFCTMAATAQKKSDREVMNLRGPVQRVFMTENRQVLQSGAWTDDTLRIDKLTVFDSKYRIIESRSSHVRSIITAAIIAATEQRSDFESEPEQFIVPSWTTVYDDDNNTTTRTYFSSDSTVSHYLFRRLNQRGDELETVRYKSDPQDYHIRTAYEYDDLGRIVRMTEEKYTGDDSLKTVKWLKYDTVGNTASIINYTSDSTIDSRMTVRIDTIGADGNREMGIRYEITVYDAHNEPFQRIIQLCDSFNRKRSEQSYMLDRNDTTPMLYNEYDENEQRVLTISPNLVAMMKEKKRWERTSFVYDSLGNEIAQYVEHFASYPGIGKARAIRYDSVTTELKYDQYSNWIRKDIRRTGAGEPVESIIGIDPPYIIQRREITYFTE